MTHTYALVRCSSCPQTFYTVNEMSTHHLDAHERPLPVEWVGVRQISPRLTPFRPPNHKAQAARLWQTNGAAVPVAEGQA
jgi:hypothetical protein